MLLTPTVGVLSPTRLSVSETTTAKQFKPDRELPWPLLIQSLKVRAKESGVPRGVVYSQSLHSLELWTSRRLKSKSCQSRTVTQPYSSRENAGIMLCH